MPSLLSTTQKTYGPSQKEWKTVAVKAKLGGDELKKISLCEGSSWAHACGQFKGMMAAD